MEPASNDSSLFVSDEDYISCPLQKIFRNKFKENEEPVIAETTDGGSEPMTPGPDPNYHEIDQNGDVVLVLNMAAPSKIFSKGATETDKVSMKLRVLSIFLASASPVFQKMLTGDFEEASRLRENASSGVLTEINLPEDDAEAMKELCEIIHHKDLKRQVGRDLESIWKGILLAEKYDCVHLVKDKYDCFLYRTQRWVSTDVDATVKVLVMSSLFENQAAFRGSTEAIIENSTWPLGLIRKLTQMVRTSLDVDWLCEDIENIREEQLGKLYKGLQDISSSILEQGHLRTSMEGSTKLSTTDCRAHRWLSFGETMNSAGVPLYKKGGNIKDILRRIKKRSNSNMKFGGCIMRKCKCRAPELGEKLLELVDSIKIKGLELAEFKTYLN